MRTWIVLLMALMLAGYAAGAATAAPPRDADQSTMPSSDAPVGVVGEDGAGARWATAQTFVAGRSGFLDVVELSAGGVSGRFLLTVEDVTETGAPNGTALATAVVDGCRMTDVTAVRFFPAAEVKAGTRYALVLRAEEGNLPGTSVNWRLGTATKVPGATYRQKLGGETPTWEAETKASPQAYSTYVRADAPAAFPRDRTTLELTAKPGVVQRYRTTTLTAHVANGVELKDSIPAGRVVFRVDGKAAEPVTVNAAGDAGIDLSWPAAGAHQITASFCPSSDEWVSSDGTTKVTVGDEKTATAVALRVNPAAAVAWQPVTLSAGVTAAETGLPAMTGTVQFSDERGAIGAPVKLDGAGTASLPYASGAGDATIRARYSGDELYAGSAATSGLSVKQAQTTASILTSANPAQLGKAIRWSIDVVAQPPSKGVPTGRVDVTIDGKKPAEFTLKQLRDGPLTVSDLAAGRHDVLVQYVGDADYAASRATLRQRVTAPDSPAGETTPASPSSSTTSPTLTPASPSPGQPAAPVPSAQVPVPVAPGATPVVRRLDEAALVRALHVPRTLTARAGKVVVGTAANPPVRSVSAALFANRATKPMALGRVRLSMAAGRQRTISVVLNRAGRRALRARGRVRVELRISALDSNGRTVRTTLVRMLRNAPH